ncbi:hypothetical protein [Myxococcus sp. RHSTA-1-4]|uniref:hypothetical protein n=1 Tax=Myxococcus sp. RHSTA-1-4 TaxID=2874601 RepID=UPI001CC01743|nr:hypothetical protein [Myxococcus sp. RHSTA-1-4]MBZ4418378.1 hypothetical protein [Myxococcus sp. RHSTA-1-4]
MKTRLLEQKCHGLAAAFVAVAASCLITACGPVEDTPVPPPLGQQEQAEESDNGLSFNGLSFNGLSFNGLSFNGLSFNGMSTSAFNTWFQADPALADAVMRYVVRCAAPAGETRSYVSPSTGQQYTWAGGLGLAPSWASGAIATELEQQVVSSCLAAHANRLGQTVSISVLGRNAAGTPLSYTAEELTSHSRRESCFFGNLFTGQGLFVGADREPLGPSESTSRACGALLYEGTEAKAPCAPLMYTASCDSLCQLDATGNFYTSCTYNGVTWHRPLTTRLRTGDVNKCGDGKCQATERCGTSNRYDSCGLDCPCP